jgi:hypothetical protein
MIFLPVPARTIAIRPGGTASFGLDFGDASNQQDPSHGQCMTQSAMVTLPVRSQKYVLGFGVNVNFCFAGFHLFVTSLQPGASPRTQ